MQALKRRATCARRSLAQIGETLVANGASAPGLAAPRGGGGRTGRGHPQSADVGELATIVNGAGRLEFAGASLDGGTSPNAKISSRGVNQQAPHYNYKPNSNPSDTVPATKHVARRRRSLNAESANPRRINRQNTKRRPGNLKTSLRCGRTNCCNWRRVWRTHAASRFPDWADIVNAAGEGLRHRTRRVAEPVERGLPQRRPAIGRSRAGDRFDQAARSISRRGAGGYFAAMVRRAKNGANCVSTAACGSCGATGWRRGPACPGLKLRLR